MEDPHPTWHPSHSVGEAEGPVWVVRGERSPVNPDHMSAMWGKQLRALNLLRKTQKWLWEPGDQTTTSWLGVGDAETLTSSPEANIRPWSAAIQAKGLHSHTRWREQRLILLPMIPHAPQPSLHFAPGSTSIPGEKDRREFERETWVDWVVSKTDWLLSHKWVHFL